jgi:hypothetical protein
MSLIGSMKRVSLRKSVAPTPRLTLWAPIALASGLSLFWLGVLALISLWPFRDWL